MNQENPFFSKPLIFFGANFEDDAEIEEECLEDPYQISLEVNLLMNQIPRTELFFHWYSFEE